MAFLSAAQPCCLPIRKHRGAGGSKVASGPADERLTRALRCPCPLGHPDAVLGFSFCRLVPHHFRLFTGQTPWLLFFFILSPPWGAHDFRKHLGAGKSVFVTLALSSSDTRHLGIQVTTPDSWSPLPTPGHLPTPASLQPLFSRPCCLLLGSDTHPDLYNST